LILQRKHRHFRNALPERLPELALAALREGQAARAFALSDRWRRIAGASATNLLARAEATKKAGLSVYALEDVLAGLKLDPLHRMLNQRLADWGDEEQKVTAARTLLGLSPRDRETGLAILAACGSVGAGGLRLEDGNLKGWAAWRPSANAHLQADGDAGFDIKLTATGSRASKGGFDRANINIDLRGAQIDGVRLLIDGAIVARTTPSRAGRPLSENPLDCSDETITLFAPVYDDFEATRACLESAEAAIQTCPDAQILVIEDESPEPAISAFIADFGRRPRCTARLNPHNLGFVGTVNRGLALIPKGDVLLFNADTLLPPGVVERFRLIARADPLIGTINPISNHGEFVSFPKPFAYNDFDEANWRRIDRAAEAANAGIAIDLPSGAGFCTFISRACLDAIGGLSDDYLNGYLEDADFGLRAREGGFRNICAPSIYVPHLGSRSFKTGKAALVARNRKTLARHFPDYEAECDAFLAMDPLAKARARVEAKLADSLPRRRLLIAPARLRAALFFRARQLAALEKDSLVALLSQNGRGWTARLVAVSGEVPQNVTLDFDGSPEAFCAEMRKWPHDHVELVEAPDLPFGLAQALAAQSRVDLLVAEAHGMKGQDCAKNLIGLDAMSRAACAVASKTETISFAPPEQDEGALGVVLPFETPEVLRFLMKLGESLEDDDREVFVFGGASMDDALIARGLFVTGGIAFDETSRIVAQYGVSRLLLPYRDGAFWALESYRIFSAAPAAYFDWSLTAFQQASCDLSLEPSLGDAEAIIRLLDWMRQ
jgi:GT2 family glycosyltransferase